MEKDKTGEKTKKHLPAGLLNCSFPEGAVFIERSEQAVTAGATATAAVGVTKTCVESVFCANGGADVSSNDSISTRLSTQGVDEVTRGDWVRWAK